MNNDSDAVHRLLAFKQARALPTAETLPFPRVAPGDALVLAFVRMGGEAMPWGFAVGHPDEEPMIASVPDPRNVGAVADLMLTLAPTLLAHLPHPATLPILAHVPDGQHPVAPALPPRQLWVPGPTHLHLLHLLDYRFTRTQTGEAERVTALRTLGRAAGWLFRESTRPGQVRVMDATQRLRELFAFPADDVRQQHLGFLLEWLPAAGSREERTAAAERAENESVGISLDPELERTKLEGPLERWHALKSGPIAERDAVAGEIAAVLREELLRRWRLAAEAFSVTRSDPRPVNPRVDALSRLGQGEFEYQYWRTECALERDHESEPFVPDAETDRAPFAAAARYFAHVHADELASSELVHGDAALLRQAIDAGDAFEGVITRVVDVGKGRTMRAQWTVEARGEHPLRLREGSGVALAGIPGRTAQILSIEAHGGKRVFTVEITGGKNARPAERAPAANDAGALQGSRVGFVATGAPGLSLRKSQAAWQRQGPGAWLTHGTTLPASGPSGAVRRDLVDLVEKLGGA